MLVIVLWWLLVRDQNVGSFRNVHWRIWGDCSQGPSFCIILTVIHNVVTSFRLIGPLPRGTLTSTYRVLSFFFFFFKFYFIELYNIVLVLPYIKMNLPQVYMCSPAWTLLPPHTIPLGRPSAPAPSIQYRALNLDWQLVSYMILYIFQCHSPKSSHPLPLPQSP